MTPLEIADRVCGGRPARCWGWKAKIWNAAYEAAKLALNPNPPPAIRPPA